MDSIDVSDDTSSGNDQHVHLESAVEAKEHLRNLQKQHETLADPNLPDDFIDEVAHAMATDEKSGVIATTELLMDNSPYLEVRSAVRNVDEGGPAKTIRAWVIGLLFATIGSALNMLFSLRSPSISINAYVAQLLAHPVGLAWARWMPNREFHTFGLRWNLNPGPWNMKEHCLVVIMANVTFGNGVAYSTDILTAQIVYYKQSWGWGFELLMTFTVSMIGFGMAGLFRKYLVEPAAMIWPSNLINTSLFYALHDHRKSDPSETNGWRIGRYRWFSYILLGSFCWYWLPGFIAPFLSAFVFVTWIRPNNVIVNQLFGGWNSISLLPITFDWTQITGYTTSPLIFPWYAVANTLFGTVFFFIICACGIHYSNTFYNLYLPISDDQSYDNTGNIYDVSRILTPQFTLDLDAYKKYSPLFLSTTFTLAYGTSFAAISALIVHTILYHGKSIWSRFRALGREEEDVHSRLYAKYNQVPIWWYAVLFVIIFGMSLATILAWDTHLSWWAFIIACLLAWIFFLPVGIIQGSTNVALGLNVVTEFMVGYMQPGKPLAMMLFKAYGYMALYQGLAFVMMLKLAVYMKVPPRTVFMGQIISCIWSYIVQIAVLNWALGNISDICAHDQKDHFTCPNAEVFFNASVIWGLIGPQRIFSVGSLYAPMLWFFLAGALTPIITWFLARRYPRSFWKYVNMPIIFGGNGMIPPATTLNYLSWATVGYIFNGFIRKRFRGWWSEYNYITSAGMDTGLALSTIIIFFCLTMTGTNMPSWWGVNVVGTTLDYNDAAIARVAPPGQPFGPKTW